MPILHGFMLYFDLGNAAMLNKFQEVHLECVLHYIWKFPCKFLCEMFDVMPRKFLGTIGGGVASDSKSNLGSLL